jgi:hypothetical protein
LNCGMSKWWNPLISHIATCINSHSSNSILTTKTIPCNDHQKIRQSYTSIKLPRTKTSQYYIFIMVDWLCEMEHLIPCNKSNHASHIFYIIF